MMLAYTAQDDQQEEPALSRMPHLLLIGRDHLAVENWRRGLADAGVTVAGMLGPIEAPLRLRSARPSVLALIEPWDVEEARETIERCRSRAETTLPAVLVLPPSSQWLEAPLLPELSPSCALDASVASAGDLLRAALVLTGGTTSARMIAAGPLSLDPLERRLQGPDGDAFLTPSEAALLTALLERPREVVRVEGIARALWGTPVGDAHSRAAIRTHLHTLRCKLTTVGADDAVRSISRVGYRLQSEQVAGANRRPG